VQRIARRESGPGQHDVPGPLYVGAPDIEDLIDHPEQGIEGGLDRVAAADGAVAVQDFLEDLGAGDEFLAIADGTLDQPARFGPQALVRGPVGTVGAVRTVGRLGAWAVGLSGRLELRP